MTNEKNKIREELQDYKLEYGLLKRVPCTLEKSKEYNQIKKDGGVLPEGVLTDEFGSYYRIQEADLTDAEISEYLTYKQLGFIRTIKNCAVFFTTLTIIGMIAYFLLLMDVF